MATEHFHSTETTGTWSRRFLIVLVLVAGGFVVFQKIAGQPDHVDPEPERMWFTLHWHEGEADDRFVNYTSNGSPSASALRHLSALVRHEIDGKEFNGSIFYRNVSNGTKRRDVPFCEFFLRREDKDTITIKLKSDVPVEIRSDDDEHSELVTADGKRVAWGTNIEQGQHDLRAILTHR
ncbi:MAG: hypothetical protein HY290_32555 [Planctomycetia bacterium]|nr:hypothetical protein [Planctomycetia bacterium]